jgi:hypothetical protein
VAWWVGGVRNFWIMGGREGRWFLSSFYLSVCSFVRSSIIKVEMEKGLSSYSIILHSAR